MRDVAFWSKVDKRSSARGCWLWQGKNLVKGYGLLSRNKRWFLAHRYSWLLRHRELPATCVLHRCDIPLCVNPDHLFLGSRADNNRDMTAKGRDRNFQPGHTQSRGERNSQAKITAELAASIRSSRKKVTDLAKEVGLAHSTVSRIRRGTLWSAS